MYVPVLLLTDIWVVSSYYACAAMNILVYLVHSTSLLVNICTHLLGE